MSTQTFNADITLIGGGMVGLSIALGLLKDTPYSLAIVESNPPKQPDLNAPPEIRLSALNLHSEKWLKYTGAWHAIQNLRAHPYTSLSVTESLHGFNPLQRLNTTRFESGSVGQSHLGYMVENSVTQWGLWQTLKHHAESSRCLFINSDYALENIQNTEHQSPCLTLKNPQGHTQTLHTQLVIGADGAESKTRSLAGIEITKKAYDQHAFVIGVELNAPSGHETWQSFKASGPVALLPMMSVDNKHYATLIWYDSKPNIDALMRLPDGALMEAIKAHYPSKLPSVTSIYGKGFFPLAKRHANIYSKNRIVLAGDAAHTINPLAGQGVNLGFKDARILVKQLKKFSSRFDLEQSDTELTKTLQKYESKRRKSNALMMHSMDLFYYGFSNRNAPLRVARNVALAMAQRSGPLKRQVLKHALGI